jgi:hypothetical protein
MPKSRELPVGPSKFVTLSRFFGVYPSGSAPSHRYDPSRSCRRGQRFFSICTVVPTSHDRNAQ